MFLIPLDPKTKKNSQQIVYKKGKPIIVQSKIYTEYEKQASLFLRPIGIDYPVNVRYMFYRETHRRVDLTNLEEAIDDIMVKAGVLKDDNCEIVAGHDGSRVMYDKDNPRTEIYIEEIE